MTGQIYQRLSDRKMTTGPLQSVEQHRKSRDWSHWIVANDSDNVAWLMFDSADSSSNRLSQAVLEELKDILDFLDRHPPRAIVLRSLKPNHFCVGADLGEFRDLKTKEQAVERLRAAHTIANRLATLPYPKVAVIHGHCLGGGLELALCCDYRLAVGDAQFGFPEVKVGLHPGLGGTARLTHLIDPLEAMSLMLAGKIISARQAQSLHLVDKVIEERHVHNAVRDAVAGTLSRTENGIREKMLTSRLARQLEARQMRHKTSAKVREEHYPAPFRLIDLWEHHGGNTEDMASAEIESFAELLASEQAQNMIRVFFLRQRLKNIADHFSPEDDPIEHLHVIGAGAMGGEIAAWAALHGISVSLFDTQAEAIGKAVAKLSELCKHKHLSQAETRAALDRLIPDRNNSGVERADLVLEAVPEKIELKRKVYQETEPRMKETALLATNTSSIPLKQLVQSLKQPSRLVGLHFFNPVAKMPLVEVVRHDQLDEAACQRVCRFADKLGKLPAPVASSPGFLVNRALTPYLLEAMVMLDEGVAAESIDACAEQFGMPMGPVELADYIGLDICQSVCEMLMEEGNDVLPPPPDWLREKVEQGHLGKKSGQGLYLWDSGHPKKKKHPPEAPADTMDRLILPMLNTCIACLDEGVVDDGEILDGAMIFGAGFAPFRGGPLAYASRRGYGTIRERLQQLKAEHGERFAPHRGWQTAEVGRH